MFFHMHSGSALSVVSGWQLSCNFLYNSVVADDNVKHTDNRVKHSGVSCRI